MCHVYFILGAFLSCIAFVFPKLKRRRESRGLESRAGGAAPRGRSPPAQCELGLETRVGHQLCFPPQPLDYESCEQYHLRVAVQNEAPLQVAAPRAERGQARVVVQVRDTNEAPVFRENPLQTSLAEGAAPGTPVATFSARDPDTQQLQRLRWGPLLGLRVRQELMAPFAHFPARARSKAEGPRPLCPEGSR